MSDERADPYALCRCNVCGATLATAPEECSACALFADVLPLLQAARDALYADNGSQFEHDSFAIMDDVYWKMLAKLSPERQREVER